MRQTDKKHDAREIFIDQYLALVKSQKKTKQRFALNQDDLYPCLADNTAYTGFDRHYVYHPAWAARIVRQINPSKHVDISSSLHFCSMVSAFIPVDFYDYRPANLHLSDLRSLSGNLMHLPFQSNTIESLSCMHTIEHIGLGRYGDPVDYDGDVKAIKELKRVLASGGNLLFVVPLGVQDKICFNAHRIYSKEHVLNLFSELVLQQFALIPENEIDGGIVIDPDKTLLNKQNYGCGCFWFKKL